MKTIWKFLLEQTDRQEIQLPPDGQILSVGEQDRELVMWALVDPDATLLEQRTIYIFGTGHQHENDAFGAYIGTALMLSGLVWHVFQDVRS